MKQILLNYCPPSIENCASPALSALQAFLKKNGFDVQIKYWNILLNPIIKEFFEFDKKIYQTEFYKLLPFYSYLAIKYNDKKKINRIKYLIINEIPYLNLEDENYIDDFLIESYKKIDNFIEAEVKKSI